MKKGSTTFLRPPKYQLHKASDLARVRIKGRDIYLGKYRSPESEQRYRQVIADWLKNQYRVSRQDSARPIGTTNRVITELILDYLTFANTIYVKDGKKTGPSSGKAMISRDQGQTWEAVEDHRVGVLPVRSCRPSSFSRSRFDVPEHAADHHQVFRLGGPIGIGCQKVVR